MIIAKTPVLIRTAGFQSRGYSVIKDSGWRLCLFELLQVFDIPDDAKEIQIFAYDRPSKNRIEATIEYPDDRNWQPILRVENLTTFFDWHIATEKRLRNLRKKLEGKVLYLECEYE